MTEFGKITVASALSVLVHVSFFTLLALWPVSARTPASKELEELPLEVELQAAPALEPPPPSTPEPDSAPPPSSEMPTSGNSDAIQTQLDPENLKKADQAPENATAIAAHDSLATPNPPVETPPQPSPNSTPDPGALTMEPAPSPTPARSEEIGIDALGNYGKAVGNAIGLRWQAQKDALPVGEVHVKFSIDAQGAVSDLQVLSNTGSPVNAACAIRALKEAKIPPIPPERLAQVPGGRIEITYIFTNYPTQ